MADSPRCHLSFPLIPTQLVLFFRQITDSDELHLITLTEVNRTTTDQYKYYDDKK